MFNIVRFYAKRNKPERVVDTVNTLAEAQAHCQDPQTSSSTATGNVESGVWFDGYREVK